MVIYHDFLSARDRDRTSSFIVSNKLAAKTSKSDLESLHLKNDAIGMDNGLASVVILCDTGLAASPPEWTFNSEDKCLRIYVRGVSQMSYPFLARIPGLEEQMVKLRNDTQQSQSQMDAAGLGRRASEIRTSPLACGLKWEDLNIDVPDKDDEKDTMSYQILSDRLPLHLL